MIKIFITILIYISIIHAVDAQDFSTCKFEKRFQRIIHRHERSTLPKIQCQLPISFDSCYVFYFIKMNYYYQNDSMLLADYLFPKVLEKRKPQNGFYGNPFLTRIETIVYSPTLNRTFIHGTENENSFSAMNGIYPHDSTLIMFMIENEIKYGLIFGITEKCVLYKNNLWTTIDNKLVLYNIYVKTIWIRYIENYNRNIISRKKL